MTLRAAFGYFSVLPVGRSATATVVAPDAAVLGALPLVGAVVGGLAGLIGAVAASVLPHGVAAALALGATIALTGGLHVDGFLDGCDAFGASVTPARRLEILKDPRHGTFAVAGMFVAGSLWYAALVALPAHAYPALLAFAGGIARFAAVLNAYAFPDARSGAVMAAAAARPPVVPLALQGIALAVGGFVLAPFAVSCVPVASGLALILGRSISRRLGGGLVGDAYGFIIVILEIGTLVALSAAGTTFG